MADVETNGTKTVEPTEVTKTDETTKDQSPEKPKSDPKPVDNNAADSPASALELKIIQQIEYYFSDANLARDKFLTEEIQKDNGWVPFTVLLTFKRLLQLSSDATVIVNAMYKSQEGLIEISDDRLKIRRNPERPLPEQNEETRKAVIAQTAYVKGFPADVTMDELIEFFNAYEKVSNVIMRKYLDKPTKVYKFKGSAFVAFASKGACEKFLSNENLKYKDSALVTQWQCDYYEAKKEERLSDKRKKGKAEEKAVEDKFEKINLPKGAVFHLDGLTEKTTRESIKEAVAALGKFYFYLTHFLSISKSLFIFFLM